MVRELRRFKRSGRLIERRLANIFRSYIVQEPCVKQFVLQKHCKLVKVRMYVCTYSSFKFINYMHTYVRTCSKGKNSMRSTGTFVHFRGSGDAVGIADFQTLEGIPDGGYRNFCHSAHNWTKRDRGEYVHPQ